MSFLKPTLTKVLAAGILLILSSWLWRMLVMSVVSDTFPHGFPFQFYEAWGPCPPGETCFEFNGFFLGLDIVVWYVAGAWIVNRFKK